MNSFTDRLTIHGNQVNDHVNFISKSIWQNSFLGGNTYICMVIFIFGLRYKLVKAPIFNPWFLVQKQNQLMVASRHKLSLRSWVGIIP